MKPEATTPPAADARPAWMRQQERGSLWLLRLMTRLSLGLGRRATRPLVALIALYFLITARAARQASRSYLSRCLGRPARWSDLYRHVHAFASTIHDRVYLLNDRFALFDLQPIGHEAVDRQHSGEGRGLLLLGAHLGSFEVLRAQARHHGQLQLSVAMYLENARQIHETLAAINPAAAPDIIPLGQLEAILTVHQRLKEGRLVGMLADRASGSDQYLQIPFLGEPAPFPCGPFRLAVMLGQPIYFMTGLYQGGNRYELHFHPLHLDPTLGGDREAQIRALMAQYVAQLERYCRAAPYNWFNFYDFWHSPLPSQS
ncbi:LpxL/LpxP family acyltransferase [Ideonella oryzae]|uniref:Acyl-CoA synthetase n=1 Tax=Ideonella oryzae TaxID=2937441 RepID=A0ABT1BK93_9BURK|nr:acyl-CoA synthetase [Ideonella oryzae]MCO5976031.1 acyl-CoA synthetase [Ideonella oryzae]